jgi:hypothetical protein
MKLYTEEQVRGLVMVLCDYNILKEQVAMRELTPIELPSDEEIIKGHDAKEFQFISFWAGAAWCRNYILNQNK